MILILLNIFLVFPKASSAQELPALSTQVNILTINEFQGLLERSKRWGEFGDQDEAGAEALSDLGTPWVCVRTCVARRTSHVYICIYVLPSLRLIGVRATEGNICISKPWTPVNPDFDVSVEN